MKVLKAERIPVGSYFGPSLITDGCSNPSETDHNRVGYQEEKGCATAIYGGDRPFPKSTAFQGG